MNPNETIEKIEEKVERQGSVGFGMYELKQSPPEHILRMILNAGMRPTPTVVYTVGDIIYNPGGGSLPDHLVVHESVHFDQQDGDPEGWWARYVTDPWFRIDQESEAYGEQYAFICQVVKDRNRRHKILLELSMFLASPIYGSVIGRDDARKMIVEKSGVKR